MELPIIIGISALIVVAVIIITVATLTTSKESSSKTNNLEDGPTPDEEKKKKEREWEDVNEPIKYVCQGGKVQCKYASPNFAEIIVTSTTVMLQDKPWATIKDRDGKVNFNFTGVCNHPSHKPSSPPPCKAVIQLGEWKNYSETIIDNYNALLVQSTIPCMISGEDLTIIDSGQKAELTQIEPKQKRQPKIIDVYWKEKGSEEKLYIEYPDYPVTMYTETEDYKPGEFVKIKIINEEGKLFKGNKKEYIVTAKVGTNGIAVVENFKINYEENLVL